MRISDWSSDVCSSDLLSREAGREVVPRCIETSCRPASGAVGRPLPKMRIQGNTRNQGNSDQMFKPDTTIEEFITLSSHVAPMVVKTTGGDYLMVWRLGGLPFVGCDEREIEHRHNTVTRLFQKERQRDAKGKE